MSVLAFPVQAQNFALSGAGSSIGDTVLNLKSFKDILGVNLTMTQFGSIGYGTIEAGNGVQEEQISFSGITQNADGTAQLTGVKHVLFIPPYTETSGMTITHPGSVTFIITNTSAWENSIYTYANTIASGGAPASSTVIGITKLSLDPVVAGTPIAVGDNDTRVPTAAQVTYIPTTTQKAALVGTGTPGAGNVYVTADTLATGLATKLSVAKVGTTTHDTSTTGTQTIAHGLGVTPKIVKISATTRGHGATLYGVGYSTGSFDGTTTTSVYLFTGGVGSGSNSSSQGLDATHIVSLPDGNGTSLATVVVDGTNIILTWTIFSSPTGTANLLWEAIG